MRISDWSSDVCSSDLLGAARHPHDGQRLGPDGARGLGGAIEIPARHLGRQCVARALQVDRRQAGQISSAVCRERVWPYVCISVVAVSLKNIHVDLITKYSMTKRSQDTCYDSE